MARRRRRSRAKENPGVGLIIALVAGAAAIGGVAYVMTRPSTPTTPTNPVAPTSTPTVSTTPITLTATINGQTKSWTYTPNAANAATDINNALILAHAGQGPGSVGESWVQQAIADGATAAQLAQLTAAGYASV